MKRPPARRTRPGAVTVCVRVPSSGQRSLRQIDPALRFAAVTPAVARRMNLRSGEVATEISGSESGQLVIGIPGLSANLRSFDVVFEALDGAKHRKLAFDPRGRGRSSDSGPGTYGWTSHARDVIEMADQLGAETFDVIGWSMGVWIAMVVAQMASSRVRRV